MTTGRGVGAQLGLGQPFPAIRAFSKETRAFPFDPAIARAPLPWREIWTERTRSCDRILGRLILAVFLAHRFEAAPALNHSSNKPGDRK
jgi:hypothetical protein